MVEQQAINRLLYMKKRNIFPAKVISDYKWITIGAESTVSLVLPARSVTENRNMIVSFSVVLSLRKSYGSENVISPSSFLGNSGKLVLIVSTLSRLGGNGKILSRLSMPIIGAWLKSPSLSK